VCCTVFTLVTYGSKVLYTEHGVHILMALRYAPSRQTSTRPQFLDRLHDLRDMHRFFSPAKDLAIELSERQNLGDLQGSAGVM
jgi:hypothetical protein